MKQHLKKGQDPVKPNVSTKEDFSLLFDQPTILDLPETCKKELNEKELEGRWIDLPKLQKNAGMHEKGWSPYKFACLSNQSSVNPFGSHSGQYDGYLIRQSLIFAVKTKEEVAKDRKRVQLRTKLLSDPAALKVKEMKDYVRNAGIKGLSVSGDDDEE